MDINIDAILENLKNGKSGRTQASLDKLNQTLKDYYEKGHRDFSITTIGHLSSRAEGVGYQSIRATRNAHYRRLIEAWAAKAETTTKKPPAKHSRSRQVPTDQKLLERITDPALRGIFGGIIAERKRLIGEVRALKQQANVVIDRRPVPYSERRGESSVELLSSLSSLLTSSEIKALEYAISDECLEKQNWAASPQTGQVKETEYDTEIFPRGFVTGIKKILGEVDSEQTDCR